MKELFDVTEIDTIAIIVSIPDGRAFQVLASKENKKLAIMLLAKLEGTLKLTKEINRVEFTEKD